LGTGTLNSRELGSLWKNYKEKGNTEAKDAITVHYLDLVRLVAGRMAMNSPPQVDKDDLIGWGVLGLMDAVEKFDPDQKASFETYASTRIRGSIIDQIRSLDWAPRSLRRKARELNQASARLKDRLGRKPSDTELAGELGIGESDLFELTTEIHGAYILSLEAKLSDNPETGETSLGDIMSDTISPSPEETVLRKEREEHLAKAIEKLSENERHVITLYYFDELTLKEIGEVLGLTESRICQIHRSVIKKMKQHLQADF
jgi:RNA polymerase sigma factor for flagellar operon FliA